VSIAFAIATGIVGVAAVLAIIGIVRASNDASAAVLSDLVFFCAIGVFVLVAAIVGSAVVFDVALIATMLGILATLALAQMLTRGRR
jgi:multicomponent Na+:H+ antiporter subunit F